MIVGGCLTENIESWENHNGEYIIFNIYISAKTYLAAVGMVIVFNLSY